MGKRAGPEQQPGGFRGRLARTKASVDRWMSDRWFSLFVWLRIIGGWRAVRIALIADLVIYLFSVIMFAVVPLFPTRDGSENLVTPPEAVIAVVGFIPVIWIILWSMDIKRFGSRWGYLATGFYGLVTMLGFTSVAIDPDGQLDTGPYGMVMVQAWLLSGIVGALLAHIVDGGKRSLLAALRMEEPRNPEPTRPGEVPDG